MTERTPPAWLQAGSYPAEDDRRLIATIFGDSEGILLSGDMAVSQRGAGANMSVDVAGGRAPILGDQATYEGSYFMENRGVTNLTVAAADPTNPRIDRVIAEVLNAEYSGASNLWRLRVMTGTPAGSPSAPATPTNAISLATVAVAALASSITNANITSTRTRCRVGNFVICTSTTRPTVNLYEGIIAYETDLDAISYYDGSGWLYFVGKNPWTAPTFSNNWTDFGSTYQTVQYRKQGDIVTVRGLAKRSTGTPAGGETILTLPAGFRPPADISMVCQEAAASSLSRVDVIASTGIVKWISGTAASAASALTLDFHFSTT